MEPSVHNHHYHGMLTHVRFMYGLLQSQQVQLYPLVRPAVVVVVVVGGMQSYVSTAAVPLLPLQGVKKTKLGLREFVKLGDFQQIIDTQQQQAVCICMLTWGLLLATM